MPRNLLFFADRLPPFVGGMEMHGYYFIEYFTNHPRFPLSGIITKDLEGKDLLISKEGSHSIDIKDLPDLYDLDFVFFNSGRWIENFNQIRGSFPKAIFLYRTGGNEILKAPLIDKSLTNHSLRQSYWVSTLNNSIDLLITNSFYTETRLRKMGITCRFERCVGGVNASALKLSELSTHHESLTIFCAARFVPYKNHTLLLSVIHELILRGHNLKVRLAGDGPLLKQIKEQVVRDNLTSVVEFLGVINNEEVCREIYQANIYMQLSADQITEVPGGSYVHSEGMGRSILEALTAGTFVIAGRSGALSEIVTVDRGILVELNDLEKLINKVESIIKFPPPKLSYLNNFGWENFFKRYEELLEDINENIADYRKI